MTGNEPAPDVCPTDTSRELTPPALMARSSTVLTSAGLQDGDAPEVVGELLFATAEAYDGVQTLRARLSTLQSQPFDLAAATAVVELLSSARWQRARAGWHVVQGMQVQVDMEATGVDDEEIGACVSAAVSACTTIPESLLLAPAPGPAWQTIDDFGAAPRGTQRVSDLLLELGTVYGWSGIRHLATSRGRTTGIGGQPC